MEKMAVDPRLVATPVGAAVGWVLTKQIFKDKATLDKQVVGAGLGAAAGYGAGEYIKAKPPWRVATGNKQIDKGILNAELKDRVSTPDVMDQDLVTLMDTTYGPVVPNVDATKTGSSRVDTSVRMRAHAIAAQRYAALAERHPEQADAYLAAAEKNAQRYIENKKKLEEGASGWFTGLRNRVWLENIRRFAHQGS